MTAAAAAAVAATAPRALTVASRLFGPLRVDPAQIITFPDGLLAFGGERRFVLLPAAHEGVWWLQSVDEGALAFLLIDPFPVFAGYAVEVGQADGSEPPAIFTIVTLPRTEGEPCTANLQGPLAVDLQQRRGRQLLLTDPGLGTRHPFDLRARLAV